MTKSEYKVVYMHQVCPFLPTHDVPFAEMSDFVEGNVLCIEIGEYNPTNWYKPLAARRQAACVHCVGVCTLWESKRERV